MVISLPITDRRNFGDRHVFSKIVHIGWDYFAQHIMHRIRVLHQLFIDYIFGINYQHYPTQIFSENVMISISPLLLYIQF